ncbi:MAG: carboxypeptidase-like regulatory domain-containing protein [Fibrobacterota bacterium]
MIKTIVNAALICLAVFFPVLSQASIKGIVLNDKGIPIPGASVTLNDNYSSTTSTDGTFSFHSSSATRTASPLVSKELIHISNSSIFINNPRSQEVTLSIFDLRGKVLYQQRGLLGSGKHCFALPKFLKNQTVILKARAGKISEHIRLTGLRAAMRRTKTGIADPKLYANVATPEHHLLVTHPRYDDRSVVANNDDSLVIRLNRKLHHRTLNYMKIGDTLSSGMGNITLSLDSIRDERCDCDAMCVWEGNAFIFFTLTVNGVAHNVSLETFDKHEISVENHILHLESISPSCPRGDLKDYLLQIALYPTNTEPVLFLENFTYQNGTATGENCPILYIDFPTYSYNPETRMLTSMHTLELTDSTRIILGTGLLLEGAAGGGASSQLRPLDTVPSTYFDSFSLEENGTVHLSYEDAEISLAPGEVWEVNSSYEETNEGCHAVITEKQQISNYGFLMPYQISASNYYNLYY